MALHKKAHSFESSAENPRINESFDFTKDGTSNPWNENFVFKAEDNKISYTNEVGKTGSEDNPEHTDGPTEQTNNFDNKNNRNNQSSESSEGASSSSSSSASSSSASSSASTVASTASSTAAGIGTAITTAVVVVIGGGMVVYGQTFEKPQVVEFERLEATTTTIEFSLLLGNNREAIDSGAENDECAITVELTCDSYGDFKQELEVKNFGRFENKFADLTPDTEYTINVYQHQLIDVNYDYLMDPVKFSTSAESTIIAPISFAITPSEIRVEEEETVTLKVTDFVPEDASKDVIWTSSNEEIAKVSSSGVVTGIATSNDPVTITATSAVIDSVFATATIYVDKASAKYNPSFDIVTDPFGEISLYGYFDVRHEERTFDFYNLSFIEVDRQTGEAYEDAETGYASLGDTPLTTRQQIRISETEIDYSALYAVRLEGETLVETGDGGSISQDYQTVSLYEGQIDFSSLPQTVIGSDDTYTNQIYFKQNAVYGNAYGDYGGNIDEMTYYQAYIDTPQVTNTVTTDGNQGGDSVQEDDHTLYVGIFSATIEDPSYNTNALETFEVSDSRTHETISKSLSSFVSDVANSYLVIVYSGNKRSSTYEEVFRQKVAFYNIPTTSTDIVENVSLSAQTGSFETDVQHTDIKEDSKRVVLDITSDYLYQLEESGTSWAAAFYEISGDSPIQIGAETTFTSLRGFTGRYGRYYYDCDPNDEIYNALKESSQEIRVVIGLYIDGTTITDVYSQDFSLDGTQSKFADGCIVFSYSGGPTSYTLDANLYITSELFIKYESIVIMGSVAQSIDTEYHFQYVISESGWPITTNQLRDNYDPYPDDQTDPTNEIIQLEFMQSDFDLNTLNISYTVYGYIEGETDGVVLFSEYMTNFS